MYKIVSILVALFLVFAYHQQETKRHYEKGKQEVQTAWNTDKEVQKALLEAERADQQQLLQSTTQKYEALLKDLTIKHAAQSANVNRLRQQLREAANSNTGTPLDPGTDCPDHAERIREVTSLLEESIGLLAEGGQRVEQLDAKVKALQELLKK